MVSRVTTAQRFAIALRAIQTTQSRVQEIQEKIVTGKRVLRPSDDPGSFSKILNLRRIIADSNQFTRNIQRTTAFANVTDQTLQAIRSLALEAKVVAIQAAGAPADEVTRAAAAVQVNRIRESILQLANSQVGRRFIFSGSKIFTPPYSDTGEYQGDQGELKINVGLNKANAVNIVGSSFLTTDLDPNIFSTSALITSSAPVTDEFVIDASNQDLVIREVPATVPVDVAVTLTTGTFTGDELAAELKAQLNSAALLGGTYDVTYDEDTDRFSINLTGGTATQFQAISVASNAASTAAGVFGFTSNSATGVLAASNVGVAFNVITGVNDTFSVTVDGGTSTLITVGPGAFTGEALASKIELGINNNVKEVTASNNTITILEDGGVRSETFALTTGTRTGAQVASDLQTQLAAAGTLQGTYNVTYDAPADKFTITLTSGAVSIGVDTTKDDLAPLMGFTKVSPFAAALISDANITGARVDYNTSFKDKFTIASPKIGSTSSISLTVGGTDLLTSLNLNSSSQVLPASTNLADLNLGKGVESGSVRITNRAGATFTVDLSASINLGDVIDKIEALVTGVKARISDDGKRLILTDSNSPKTSNLIVEEIGTTTTAFDLGIKANIPGNIRGRDLDPRVSNTTPISVLRSGAGISLGRVRVGISEIDLNLGERIAVGQILSAISGDSGADAIASISSDGKSLRIDSTDPNRAKLVQDITGSSSRDLGFQGRNNLIGLLDTLEEALVRNDIETIGRTLDDFSDALERIGQQQVVVGEITRQFERIVEQQEEIILSFGEILTKEEDTDLTQAITEFSVFQTSLQAAFASTAQILQVNLLEFLR